MKSATLFVLATLAISGVAFAQPGGYLPNDVSLLLTNTCDGELGCIPDGALIEIKWDQNNNGNSDFLTDPLASVGFGNNQIQPFNTYQMNGEATGIGCGYFYFLQPLYAQGAANPSPNAFYCVVHGTEAVWISAPWSFPAGGGFSDVEPASWTCISAGFCVAPTTVTLVPGTPVCFNQCVGQSTILISNCSASGPPLVVIDNQPLPPSVWVRVAGHWEHVYVGMANFDEVCVRQDGCMGMCVQTPLVQFISDDPMALPASNCADACVGAPTFIRVCSQTPGQPLNPIYVPIVMVMPGCSPITFLRDRECEPGITEPNGFIPYDLWQYVNGCFETVLVGIIDGCVCITIEGALPTELAAFEATPLDSRVQVDFATSSESDLSRFEITRKLHGHDDELVIGSLPAHNAATGASYQFTDHDARNGTTYVYGLAVLELDGTRRVLNATGEATPRHDAALITEYALQQNFPNPFNPSTQITVDLVDPSPTRLTVYDVTGRVVDELANSPLPAVRHTFTFKSRGLPSGLYFYTVRTATGFTATKKMLLLK